MPLILFAVTVFLSGCAIPESALRPEPEQRRDFDHSALPGVWEVTGYQELAGPIAKPGEHRPNWKYCFTKTHVYRELSPDASNDSADGWEQYDILRDMIICSGLLGDTVLRVRSLSKDRLEIVEGAIFISLRRVARAVDMDDFRTPILPEGSLPVRRIGE